MDKRIEKIPKINNTIIDTCIKGDKLMENKKYVCKICGQTVKPLPDGSCPICGAPSEMLEPVEDSDEERY